MRFGHGSLEIGDSRSVQLQDTAVHSKVVRSCFHVLYHLIVLHKKDLTATGGSRLPSDHEKGASS